MPKTIRQDCEDLQSRLAAQRDFHGRSEAGRLVAVALTDLEKLTAWVAYHPAAFAPPELQPKAEPVAPVKCPIPPLEDTVLASD